MVPSPRQFWAITFSGLWIGFSEFFRNQVLLVTNWRDHYGALGMSFPSAPINAVVWILWSFVFASLVFVLSRRWTLLQTTLIAWTAAFPMMWLVAWNLSVLPVSILLYAVPLSLLESLVASLICNKVLPPRSV